MAKEKTEGIFDPKNIPAVLKWLQDMYDVTSKDLGDILNPTPVMGATGCCDHGKCCDQTICLLTQALMCELRHKAQCEAECDDGK